MFTLVQATGKKTHRHGHGDKLTNQSGKKPNKKPLFFTRTNRLEFQMKKSTKNLAPRLFIEECTHSRVDTILVNGAIGWQYVWTIGSMMVCLINSNDMFLFFEYHFVWSTLHHPIWVWSKCNSLIITITVVGRCPNNWSLGVTSNYDQTSIVHARNLIGHKQKWCKRDETRIEWNASQTEWHVVVVVVLLFACCPKLNSNWLATSSLSSLKHGQSRYLGP